MEKYMDFFNWKKFPKEQWAVLGIAVTILLLFLWREYERDRPYREFNESFDKFERDLKKSDCEILWKYQNWTEYDKQKCSSL